MKQAPHRDIRDLIERIARINAADEWTHDLNPTQWLALSYLGRANRFSRAPSQVAEFMSATRGTVSQTLKALARKGLIEEIRSQSDRRWISYTVTKSGAKALNRSTAIDEAIDKLKQAEIDTLAAGLQALVRGVLKARDKSPFGICKTCRHHKRQGAGGFCVLLGENLRREEVQQICHEHREAT